MGITIKYSERNRQTVVLAQCGVFIVNIFLALAITISDTITSLLHKPFIFWLYDNCMGGEKRVHKILTITHSSGLEWIE